MSIVLTINGQAYDYPERGDLNWGTSTTDWASAVSLGTLQKSGGSFVLSSEVNFGTSYGIKGPYFKTSTADIAASGEFRLAKTDTITFRNNANSGDLEFGIDSIDRPTFNSVLLLSGQLSNSDISASAAISYSKLSLTNSVLNADIGASAGIVYSKLNLANGIVNADINSAAAIAISKLGATTASRVLTTDVSGLITASSITTTTLGYLDATSSVQTQLNNRLLLSGGSITGAIAMNGFKISGGGTPTADTDYATKLYVDGLVVGLTVHTPVRLATTVNVTFSTGLANGQIVDTKTLVTGDRILVKDQSVAGLNGIYTVNVSGAPTRATDGDTWAELFQAYVLVTDGSTNVGTGWVATIPSSGTIGVDDITFAQFSAATSVTAGVAINLTGTLLDVKYDNSTIGINGSNQLIVKALGITDGEISVSAAIAISKLGATTASRVLTTDAGGLITASSTSLTTLSYLDATSSIQTQINALPTFSNLLFATEAHNVGFSTSVGSNALTINLKQADGSTNCSTGASAARITFRSSTLTSGSILQRSITGALSIVIPSGATLGVNDGAAEYIYVYGIDNAGTVELAVSCSNHWDEGNTYTTTVLDSSSDDAATLYSTTARTLVAIRLLCRIAATETTAGFWTIAPTIASSTNLLKPIVVSKAASFNAKHGISYLVSTASARNITLPTPRVGLVIEFKDSTGQANNNNITVVRFGSEQIEGIAASKTFQTNWGSWSLICDGTNWFIR